MSRRGRLRVVFPLRTIPMADLTLKDVFGDSVSYDSKTKEITFTLASLAGQDFDPSGISSSNCPGCASRVLWAWLNRIYINQPSQNTDPDRGIYITNQGRRTVTRGGVRQFGFQLVVNGYSADTVGTKLPADNLIRSEVENTNG